jgi:hypothetical protein
MNITKKEDASHQKQIYELTLHGLIHQSKYDQLVTRLDGICGNNVHQHASMRFKTWETVHATLRTMPTNASQQAIVGRVPKEQVEFRVITEHNKDNDSWQTKHIKYIGKTIPSSRDRTFRTCVRQVAYGHVFSDNVIPFLNLIKCDMNFEYVKKGIRFLSRNNVQIEISQLYRMETLNAPTDDKIVCADDINYLVQLSCESAYEEVALVEANMISIADNLSTIVLLYKETALPKGR